MKENRIKIETIVSLLHHHLKHNCTKDELLYFSLEINRIIDRLSGVQNPKVDFKYSFEEILKDAKSKTL